MPAPQKLTGKSSLCASILLALGLQLVAVGCQSRKEPAPADAGRDATPSDAGALALEDAGSALPPEYPYPARLHYLELAGRLDKTNRYSAAVDIETAEPTEAGVHGLCSGVLLSPRLVLTAGHCVCMRRSAPDKSGKFIIDGTACSRSPTVTTMVYASDAADTPSPGTGSQFYKGVEVRPHPALEVVLDAQGRMESSRGDLALIILEAPVKETFSSLPLASEDVQAGESFVMVGGTFDETLGGIAQQRRFMRYKVAKFMDAKSGWVLYEQPRRDLYRGSSGGPCVRESAGGPVLIGVSSRGLGGEPTFTSLHSYLDWLRSALRLSKPE